MRFVIPGKLEGIGWYSFETATRMARNHPEHQFLFLFDRPFDPNLITGKNITGHVVSPPARHPFLWFWWFEVALPHELKKLRADVFFSPDGYCSLRCPLPTLMVVHDLAFEHFSDHVPPLVLWYYRYFSPRYARRATRLATVSEATCHDLVQRYGIDPAKISVVYNGANTLFTPLTPAAVRDARAEYAAGLPYFIYVGSVHPRKNLARLLIAFDHFADHHPDHALVVAGRMAWQTGSVHSVLRAMRHRNRVHLAGHLEPASLKTALGGATGLLYPSLFEGFGIPILEAFYAEVPVLTSNCSSMPEVAGQAALLINPEDEKDIARGMGLLATDPALRERLIAAGREQRRQFSWDNTARLTWEALEQILPPH